MFEFLWILIVGLVKNDFVYDICVMFWVGVVRTVLCPVVYTLTYCTSSLNNMFVKGIFTSREIFLGKGWVLVSPVTVWWILSLEMLMKGLVMLLSRKCLFILSLETVLVCSRSYWVSIVFSVQSLLEFFFFLVVIKSDFRFVSSCCVLVLSLIIVDTVSVGLSMVNGFWFYIHFVKFWDRYFCIFSENIFTSLVFTESHFSSVIVALTNCSSRVGKLAAFKSL